ncbi:chromosomal replication initiator protein DnaA [Patescibacteria group bacterium]|nr:chromosomal replication initiator protein DnaA [Patescibacteria group bacterium]MBU2219121.1 chromosomal replication initiator protein DnaA [Patescibacteria group bacterium]
MTIDYEKLWKDALVEIELNVSRANFITWFKNTSINKEENGAIFLGVPNTFVKEWLSGKYHKFILRAINNLYPSVRSIEYLIVPQSVSLSKNRAVPIATPLNSEEQLGFNEFYIDREANLNPKYTFESFIVGSFNEVAHAAALAVTKGLGNVYNPLFIYGGVGLGKTHLLQAVGNKAKELSPDIKIHYLTSEKFASDFINAVQNKNIYDFKEKYRRYNLLIIDDIQFFSDKLKIQEEFFHIFNTLYERNNQLVFSSDRSPKHIIGLEERLRSRFEGGMMVDISKPELEARIAILKTKAEAKGFPVDQDVIEYIASAIQENIRELEGALNSIIGQSKIKGKILSINEVKEILKKNAKPAKTITFTEIIKTISSFYEINEKSLFEKTRKKEIVKPRQIAMYLLREDLNISYPYIGQKFGQRDHTTVIHAYRKIERSLKKDDKLIEEIENIRGILYGKIV